MVSAFMKELGRAAVSRQVVHHMEEAPPAKPPPATVEQLDEMGQAGLRRLAKSLGVKQKAATVAELRERLRKHLQKWRLN